MENPWGSSPWAAETDDDHENEIRATESASLEPPPRAFLFAASPKANNGLSTQNPWGNDDNGGAIPAGWSSSDPAEIHQATNGAAATPSPGWSGWVPGGEAASVRQRSLSTARGYNQEGASPVAWPQSAASPSKRPSHSNSDLNPFFLQPSPDPWTTGFFSPSTSPAREPSPIRLDNESPARLTPESRSPKLSSIPVASASAPGVGSSLVPELSELDIQGSNGAAAHVGDAEAASRPPSSLSDLEHSNGDPESPITSIDEGSRAKSQDVQRQASTKVQSLVDMYDELAKRVDTESPAPGGLDVQPGAVDLTRPSSPDDNVCEDADPDFREFEDANLSDAEEEEQQTTAEDRERTSSPPSTSLATDAGDTQQHRESPNSAGYSNAPILSVPFQVDMSKIDELFDESVPAIQMPSDTKPSDVYIPDTLPHDSFTSISQRKAWYRISRQGSSRKHDLGDDTGYRRVAWLQSAVQADTVKIVRRWMEEDSITGRATLGGAGAKGNIFGWNSDAKPVTLDEIFKRKSGSSVGHQKSFSQPIAAAPPPPPPSPRSRIAGQDGQRRVEEAVTPSSASSGWSSLSAKQSQTKRSSSHKRSETEAGRPRSRSTIANQSSSQGPMQTNGQVQHANIDAIGGSGGDEDDDWGEMISSPPIASTTWQKPPPGNGSLEPVHDASRKSEDKARAQLTETTRESSDGLHTITHAISSAQASPLSLLSQPARAPSVPEKAATADQTPPPPPPVDELTAQRIIASLPDLSYMFR